MLKKNREKGYVKAIKKKLPPFKGKSKIKEGECLLSLGKTKEVSIKERHNKCQKVDTITTKKTRATNMTFGIHDKAPDVIILRLVIYQRKSWICIMTYENSDI
jgi:hypothetical protein